MTNRMNGETNTIVHVDFTMPSILRPDREMSKIIGHVIRTSRIRELAVVINKIGLSCHHNYHATKVGIRRWIISSWRLTWSTGGWGVKAWEWNVKTMITLLNRVTTFATKLVYDFVLKEASSCPATTMGSTNRFIIELMATIVMPGLLGAEGYIG